MQYTLTRNKKVQAPKFIYGKIKNVFRDVQRKKYGAEAETLRLRSLLQAPKFIYGVVTFDF